MNFVEQLISKIRAMPSEKYGVENIVKLCVSETAKEIDNKVSENKCIRAIYDKDNLIYSKPFCDANCTKCICQDLINQVKE